MTKNTRDKGPVTPGNLLEKASKDSERKLEVFVGYVNVYKSSNTGHLTTGLYIWNSAKLATQSGTSNPNYFATITVRVPFIPPDLPYATSDPVEFDTTLKDAE